MDPIYDETFEGLIENVNGVLMVGKRNPMAEALHDSGIAAQMGSVHVTITLKPVTATKTNPSPMTNTQVQ